MPKKTETRPATAHIAPFGLRMQAELRLLLESEAERHGRSLNAEIVSRLSGSFAAQTDLTLANDEELGRFCVDSLAAIDRAISLRIQELDEVARELPPESLRDQRDRLQVTVFKWRRHGDVLRHALDSVLLRFRATWRRLYQEARTHGINLATDSEDEASE